MDYEKKRKEALKAAKLLYTYSGTDEEFKKGLLKTFPELESEDERTRKGLLYHLKELKEWKVGEMSPIKTSGSYDAWISYLEKQKDLVDIDFISTWLREHARNYINGEYNEFHHCVDYDGTIDVERLINDLKKELEL